MLQVADFYSAPVAGFFSAVDKQAYLLAKGDVRPPAQPIPDVIEFPYTGNKLHPTQKPVATLKPLIEAFCPAQGTLLDSFAGSGSALVAARQLGRQCVGIEPGFQCCPNLRMLMSYLADLYH